MCAAPQTLDFVTPTTNPCHHPGVLSSRHVIFVICPMNGDPQRRAYMLRNRDEVGGSASPALPVLLCLLLSVPHGSRSVAALGTRGEGTAAHREPYAFEVGCVGLCGAEHETGKLHEHVSPTVPGPK